MILVHVAVAKSTKIVMESSNESRHSLSMGVFSLHDKINEVNDMELAEIGNKIELMTNRIADFRGSL